MNPRSVPRIAHTTLIAFAAGFAGVMPMTLDIYLILMPEIARDFGASLAATHATLVAFAFGFGVAHLFVGVLADRYGRRPLAIWGGGAFLLATLAVTLSTSLELLMACRFVQGLAVATSPILSRAIVRDAVPPERAAGAYALVHGIAALAPLTAPFIASVVSVIAGWRGAMACLLLYGGVLLVSVILKMPETRPVRGDDEIVATPFAAAREVLTNPRFIAGGLVTVLLYSALFTWLSTSPFLMMDGLGFSRWDASIVLGFGSLGYMAGSLITARVAGRYSPERMIAVGAPLMLVGTLGCLVALSRADPGPFKTLFLMLPFYLGLGFTHANALQIVMRPFPHMAGQASAWLGIVQQIGGITISVLAVRAGAGFAAIWVMVACCAAMVAVSAVLPRVLRR